MPKIIDVKVITRARRNEVVNDNRRYKIRVTAVPTDGKANQMVLKLLSDYFQRPVSAVTIISGDKSSVKRIRID
ncbi:MAG: DUF167 domain-containing protein [Candidatus Komeilibacteria bacterium]|nr:DUF167 domain-containing protein [Candidatus Komeilibacteria bacterium]